MSLAEPLLQFLPSWESRVQGRGWWWGEEPTQPCHTTAEQVRIDSGHIWDHLWEKTENGEGSASLGSCFGSKMDWSVGIPLRHVNPPLQMALSVFGNGRQSPGPLDYVKRPFWAIMLVFVDRNDACEGRTLFVATHILLGVFCCTAQSRASKLQNLESSNLQILSYPTPLASGKCCLSSRDRKLKEINMLLNKIN